MLCCVCVKVVKVFILPVLRAEADRLETVLEGPLGNNTDRIAADHVKLAVLVCRLTSTTRSQLPLLTVTKGELHQRA